jgi:hypothetical protein
MLTDSPADKSLTPETTSQRLYRIDRRQIHFLKFILEGYDGVAVLRTLDREQGLVKLSVGPGSERVVDMIIEDLKMQVRIEPVGPGEDLRQV